MYANAALLSGLVLLYTLVAGRVERSWVSGPMLFVAVGFALGRDGLGVLDLPITGQELRVLAEIALAMVLFTDAANADLAIVRRSIGLPERLLLIGLPLTILLGVVLAMPLFPDLQWLEVALLATMLAPTDAALGKPVVTNPSVPPSLREALNLESGFNDGICVPVLLILLELAVGTQVEHASLGHVVYVVVEEIGIGLVAGIGLTGLAVLALRVARRFDALGEGWAGIPMAALAGLCFAAAQAAGGSGFIACFAGGLLLSAMEKQDKHHLLHEAETVGATAALLTWVLFGAIVVGQVLPVLTWQSVVYAVLSLTVIRMLPVWLCLRGTGLGAGEKLFIGWFGPRGLASIVFAVLVVDARLPGNSAVIATAACAVVLSVLAHGLTATPLAARFARAPVG